VPAEPMPMQNEGEDHARLRCDGGPRVAHGHARRAARKHTRFLTGSVALAAILISAPSLADVKMTVQPILGANAPPGFGFSELVVRLESTEKLPVRGTLTAASEAPAYRSKDPGGTTAADFVLAPSATTTLRIPVVAQGTWQLEVVARGGDGKEFARETVRTFSREQPLLVDLRTPSRLPAVLSGVAIHPHRPAPSGSGRGGTGVSLIASAVTVDPTTGDPLLPDRPVGYAQATVVCVPSDVLARMVGAELDAMVSYVLAGGTLAITVMRPEDLRHPTLTALVGGAIEDTGTARHLASHSVRIDPPSDPSAAPAPPPMGGGGSAGSSSSIPSMRFATPSATTREALRGYAGGNLIPSDFGATAAYGLGEVHLLAFDAGDPTQAQDPWVGGVLAELATHAWDRSTSVVSPLGAGIARPQLQDVRKQLDPNEGSRWAIFVAAFLLLGYSAIAGPWNFLSASRAGKPLRALKWLPALSLGTFALVVGLGFVSRGFRGQSRRLSFLELSGGMPRGPIHRFRGFFTPQATTMKVSTTTVGAVLDLPLDETAGARSVVHRDGIRMENVATLPWETVVVREEDFATLGNGITLGRRADGDVDIVNKSGRSLRGVLVQVPHRGVFFHGMLKDGAAVLGASGARLGFPAKPSSYSSRGLFDGFTADTELDGLSPGLSDAWRAIEHTATRAGAPHYWPSEVPVLLAQADGGEGTLLDAGLRVDRERLLVRVVGFGGAP
jgi:hypothetical protein